MSTVVIKKQKRRWKKCYKTCNKYYLKSWSHCFALHKLCQEGLQRCMMFLCFRDPILNLEHLHSSFHTCVCWYRLTKAERTLLKMTDIFIYLQGSNYKLVNSAFYCCVVLLDINIEMEHSAMWVSGLMWSWSHHTGEKTKQTVKLV